MYFFKFEYFNIYLLKISIKLFIKIGKQKIIGLIVLIKIKVIKFG